MPDRYVPALTPEQWEARDYRQAARELDRWAQDDAAHAGDDDSTEYVAKLGLNAAGSVIAMSRAHDRVLVPPPARPVLAAFALDGQPFGFTHADVALLMLGQNEQLSCAAWADNHLGDRMSLELVGR